MQYQFSFVFVAVVLFLYSGARQLPVQQIKFRSCNQSSEFYPETNNCTWAMDGNSSAEDCYWQVSYTKHELNAWWLGTLEEEASISVVRIVGGNSEISWTRLDSFKIILDGGKVCAEINSSTNAGEQELFSCVGDSKTVKIQASGSNHLVLCEVSVYGKPSENCPPGYKHYKSGLRCYSEPSSTGMTYSDAKAWCKKHGGILPEFTTKEEIDNFNSFAPDVDFGNFNYGFDGYWLGAFRKGTSFRWESNGAKLTVDAFAAGEPNNYKVQENRLSVVKNPNRKNHYNKWNDCYSYWRLHVICQFQ